MDIFVVYKGIDFGIEIDGLPEGEFVANLCSSDKKFVISGMFDGNNVLWSSDITETANEGDILALEIYKEDKSIIFAKERFAIVKNTSVWK